MRLSCATLAIAAVVFLAGCFEASAQDVTLLSQDGNVELSGTLLGFDGEFYRVETIYGELTVDGSRVRCDGPGCPNTEDYVADLSISGSATMGAVLLPALIEGFAQRNGYQTERIEEDPTHFRYNLIDQRTGKRVAIFRVRVTNTDEGFADLLANEADMVMSRREIRSEEMTRAIEAGMGDMGERHRSRVLALDAIVPVVSPSNPVREISPQDLALVYAGEIVNWRALGGVNAPIALHAPSLRTGLGQAAADRILRPIDLDFSVKIAQHDVGSELAQAVLDDPFALGIASYAEIGETQPLILQGSCGRAIRTTRRSIKTEDYPLTAPMFLYTPARRLPKVGRAFLSFSTGLAAQVMIRRSGFVDQALEEVPVDQQGDRFINAIAAAGPEISLPELQRMVDRLDPMKRLTISFRFEAGSSRLDAQSRSNIGQLARELDRGKFDARQIFFLGFSDGDGPAAVNRQVALASAEAVRDAVRQATETADLGEVTLMTDTFGEAMPLACDESAWGRKANRRVEVWVR